MYHFIHLREFEGICLNIFDEDSLLDILYVKYFPFSLRYDAYL